MKMSQDPIQLRRTEHHLRSLWRNLCRASKQIATIHEEIISRRGHDVFQQKTFDYEVDTLQSQDTPLSALKKIKQVQSMLKSDDFSWQ